MTRRLPDKRAQILQPSTLLARLGTSDSNFHELQPDTKQSRQAGGAASQPRCYSVLGRTTLVVRQQSFLEALQHALLWRSAVADFLDLACPTPRGFVAAAARVLVVATARVLVAAARVLVIATAGVLVAATARVLATAAVATATLFTAAVATATLLIAAVAPATLLNATVAPATLFTAAVAAATLAPTTVAAATLVTATVAATLVTATF